MKKYIGVRSSELSPEDDLGVYYFSSSANTNFIKSQKDTPSDFHYDVLGVFDTRKEAANHEIELHNFYNVGSNPEFINQCKSISTGYSTLGTKHTNPNKPGINNSNAKQKIVYLWDTSILKCDGNITSFYRNVNSNAIIKIEDYKNQKYHSLYKNEIIKIYDYIPNHTFLKKTHNVIITPNNGTFYFCGNIGSFKDKIKNSRSKQIKYKISNGYPIHLNITNKPPAVFTLNDVECPKCGKTGTSRQMTRYHFDNCKKSK